MNTQTLIITEKPSVARAIAFALGANVRGDGCIHGNNLIVSWCYGHLIELASPAAYDEKLAKWRREDLPILPNPWQTVVMRDKRQQFEILRGLMQRKDVGEVVNACDAGREGELIFRLVYEKAGCNKPVKRLWLSSMEPAEIRPALRRRAVPGKGRLACRHERHAAYVAGVPQDTERGARGVPDARAARRAKARDRGVPAGNFLHRRAQLRRCFVFFRANLR